MSNDKTTFKPGDKVAYFGREAEIAIHDLGDAYWTWGARIKYTTGDRAGQLADVPVADLMPLAQDQTADAKARAAAEAKAAKRDAWRAKIREDLVAKAALAVKRIAAHCVIDLHAMSQEERDSILCGVAIATSIYNEAIVGEAIDRVKNKTRKETT